MLVDTPISLGELVDKISILMIKKKNIIDKDKISHVNKELDFLKKTLIKYIEQENIQKYLEKLVKINSKLWKIEDEIRECERKKIFNQKFIDLARNVYFTNDERAKVKSDINKIFGSELVEVKSYEEY